MFFYDYYGIGGLLAYLPQKNQKLTTVKVGDPNAQLGIIARFNCGSEDSFSWICRDLKKDSERFLMKPFEEIFDANLDVMIVSTTVFEAKNVQYVSFKERFVKTITNRGRIIESFAEGLIKTGSWTAVRFQRIRKNGIRMTVLDLIEEEDGEEVKPSRNFAMKIPLTIEETDKLDTPVRLYLFQDEQPKHRRTFCIRSSEDVRLLSAFLYPYNPSQNHTLQYNHNSRKYICSFHFSEFRADGYPNLSRHYFSVIQTIQKRQDLGEIVASFSALMTADHIASYNFGIAISQYSLEFSINMIIELCKSEFKLTSKLFLSGSVRDNEHIYYARPFISGALHYFEKKVIQGKNTKLTRLKSEKDLIDLKIEADIFGFVQTGPENSPVFGDKIIFKREMVLDITALHLKSIYGALFSSTCETDFWAEHLMDLIFEKDDGKISFLVGFAFISLDEFDELKDKLYAKLMELLSMEPVFPVIEPAEEIEVSGTNDPIDEPVDNEFEEALKNFGSFLPDVELTWNVSSNINGMISKRSVTGLNAQYSAIILQEVGPILNDSSSWLKYFLLKLEPARFPFGRPTEQRIFQLKYSIHPSSPFEVLKKSLADVVRAINFDEGRRAVVEISFTIEVQRNSLVVEVLYFQTAATTYLLSSLSGLK